MIDGGNQFSRKMSLTIKCVAEKLRGLVSPGSVVHVGDVVGTCGNCFGANKCTSRDAQFVDFARILGSADLATMTAANIGLPADPRGFRVRADGADFVIGATGLDAPVSPKVVDQEQTALANSIRKATYEYLVRAVQDYIGNRLYEGKGGEFVEISETKSLVGAGHHALPPLPAGDNADLKYELDEDGELYTLRLFQLKGDRLEQAVRDAIGDRLYTGVPVKMRELLVIKCPTPLPDGYEIDVPAEIGDELSFCLGRPDGSTRTVGITQTYDALARRICRDMDEKLGSRKYKGHGEGEWEKVGEVTSSSCTVPAILPDIPEGDKADLMYEFSHRDDGINYTICLFRWVEEFDAAEAEGRLRVYLNEMLGARLYTGPLDVVTHDVAFAKVDLTRPFNFGFSLPQGSDADLACVIFDDANPHQREVFVIQVVQPARGRADILAAHKEAVSAGVLKLIYDSDLYSAELDAIRVAHKEAMSAGVVKSAYNVRTDPAVTVENVFPDFSVAWNKAGHALPLTAELTRTIVASLTYDMADPSPVYAVVGDTGVRFACYDRAAVHKRGVADVIRAAAECAKVTVDETADEDTFVATFGAGVSDLADDTAVVTALQRISRGVGFDNLNVYRVTRNESDTGVEIRAGVKRSNHQLARHAFSECVRLGVRVTNTVQVIPARHQILAVPLSASFSEMTKHVEDMCAKLPADNELMMHFFEGLKVVFFGVPKPDVPSLPVGRACVMIVGDRGIHYCGNHECRRVLFRAKTKCSETCAHCGVLNARPRGTPKPRDGKCPHSPFFDDTEFCALCIN